MMDAFTALLEARDPAHGRFRSYRLEAGADLFGAWIVELTYGLADAHFSLAVCHDIPARADRFANRADGFCMKGLASDLSAP
jgi:hypothetical protein